MSTVRVYKVAELLNTTSQEVLALLKKAHGIELKSASSTLEEIVARQFVDRLSKQRNITLPKGDIFSEQAVKPAKSKAAPGKKGAAPAPEPPKPAAPSLGPPRLIKVARPAEPVPDEAVVAVVEAARSVGCRVVVDLSRAGPAGASAVVADADVAVLVVPARLRAATAARLLVDAPASSWAAAQLVVGRVPGGLSCDEVAAVVGRPVLAELAHDRSAVPRGERGEPPDLSPRSPLGAVSRRILTVLGDR